MEYALARHSPALHGVRPWPWRCWAQCEAHAALVARWMQVGFIHGVMNTDNMSIAGETLDYGPCAFLDTYDPATVFSAIDQQGRYAFGNQPRIAHWNLARLAETLAPPGCQSREGPRAGCGHGQPVSGQVRALLAGGHAAQARALRELPDDADLIDTLLALMHAHAADYTNTFRQLCAVVEGGAPRRLRGLGDPLADAAGTRGPHTAGRRYAQAHNPAVIPRNHRVEAVLDAAVHQGDCAPLEAFLAVLATPCAVAPHQEAYSAPPAPSERVYQTFCGT